MHNIILYSWDSCEITFTGCNDIVINISSNNKTMVYYRDMIYQRQEQEQNHALRILEYQFKVGIQVRSLLTCDEI